MIVFASKDRELRTALVTGACSGIGLAIARRLAERGLGLVVVSERPEALERAGEELRDRGAPRVDAIPMDLAQADAAADLHARVTELGVAIDVLVNNAGFFFFGEATDADPGRAQAMLLLHVVTPSLLATRLGREMRARRRGHVLFVSSLSAVRDFPGIAYYGSSKKYLRGFARALRSELAPYDVNVTCLLPGATATGLYDPNVVPVALAERLGVMMSPDAVATAGLEAMFAREAECMPGLLTRAMAWTAERTPQRVVDAVRRYGPWMRPGR